MSDLPEPVDDLAAELAKLEEAILRQEQDRGAQDEDQRSR
jgi:hypothetical protein